MSFSAYYICNEMKRTKPDSPATPVFLYLFFYICRRDGCSPAGVIPGLWLSLFLWRKKKKKEKERMARECL